MELIMTDAEYRKLIARNLKRIAYDNHKTQSDIVRDLKLKQPTVSSWMNGTRMIQMPEIDMLCNYFNCSRAEIMEETPKIRRENISADEQRLIALFRSLNAVGRSEAIRRISEMAKLNEYIKEQSAGKVG